MGTKQENHGLSDTITPEQEFEAISKAMTSGDQAELDRLMAIPGKPEEKETEEEVEDSTDVVEEKTEETTSTKDETTTDEEDDSKKVDTTEAAKSAASTDKTEKKEENELDTLRQQVHQYKSDAGRVPYLQRRLSELERELRASKARSVTSTSKTDASTSSKTPKDVELDPEVQKDIDDLKEIDPVLARTMERIAKTAVAAASERVDSAVTAMTQQEQEAEDFKFFTEQKSMLLTRIPQADAIFATPEWKQWKESLTPNRRALAESGYAEEVEQAIYAFAADMRSRQGTPETAAPVAKVEETTPETEVSKARQRKVQSSAEVPNPSARKTEQFDDDQAFSEMYRKLAQANHIL